MRKFQIGESLIQPVWNELSAIGDKGRAIEWLEKAFTERESDLLLDTDHSWDRWCDDPRFATLVQRVGSNS